jgi:futalosine hydrolase
MCLLAVVKLLLAAATEAEIAPLLAHLQEAWQPVAPGHFSRGDDQLYICITGVGMMATLWSLMNCLRSQNFDFALQTGVGGSYDRSIDLGTLLFVTSDQYGDLGAQDHYNYLDIFDLGLLQPDEFPFTGGKLLCPPHPLHVRLQLPQASALTVNTVAGADFMVRARRHKFNCQVESMEGAAFHYVCLREQIPFAQLRAISNYVEPRDKSKWKMKEAVINLNNWLIDFLEQL